MTLAARLGEFAAKTRSDDLPSDVIDDIKLRLLDQFGAALSGIESGGWRDFDCAPAPGLAGIWPTGAQGAARDAVFLNSFVSHAAYLEDGSRFSGGHPSCVVIAPALAAFEEGGYGSGKDLLAAIAIGYEVFLRLGRAVYPEAVRRGFQTTAALGAVAAAAATASAKRLSQAEASHAIAIAATMGFGLKHALMASRSQPLQVARSCQGGVIAAEAAGRGSRGALDILEASFLPLLGATTDPDAITAQLGTVFSVSETYIKLHGGCRGNHAPIDIVHDLLMRSGRGPAEISRIRIAVDTVTHEADIERPETPEQAQFSARFAVAAHLLAGDALPERYSASRLADPVQIDLMNRIALAIEPELDAGYPQQRGAWAWIEFKDGKTVEGRLSHARGEPENPAPRASVEEKFRRLTSSAPGHSTEHLRQLVANLEDLSDLRELAEVMCQGRSVKMVARQRRLETQQ